MGYLITIDGIVQGVGFRPFVYNLASDMKLKGYVKNSTKGVIIYLDSNQHEKNLFLEELKKKSPRASFILSIDVLETNDNKKYNCFEIIKSEETEGITMIPSDLSICEDCTRELFDPQNRRYQYPFINCTNCGPRYSIIKSIPYDRQNTTMDSFHMCKDCEKEYNDVKDRRFHAQPNCCLLCGPEVYYGSIKGIDAIKRIANLIDEGEIVAVKGLGGYHIICNATNEEAVKKLRYLKNRFVKPFAIMVSEISTLEKYDFPNKDKITELMNQPQSPIVIFSWKNHPLAKNINPLGDKIGVMVAYTPIHKLLFKFLKTKFIVATSGNLKDEPIVIDEKEACEKLTHYTKHILHHNRPIHNRVDDSVMTILNNSIYPIRRSRGFAPNPIILNNSSNKSIFGAGAGLKSHLGFSKGRYIFISQYIGDLDNVETENFYIETFHKLKELFKIEPTDIVIDLHPDYRSSIFASEYAIKNNLPVHKLQHHKAHMLSCMAENHLEDNTIGVIFDGTGLGEDGNIWGGEIFYKQGEIKRRFHLQYFLQPGGDLSAKNPYKMLLGYLIQIDLNDKLLKKTAAKFKAENELEMLKLMLTKKINSPYTSSIGRLFEAFGSLITGVKQNEFEGHTAIYLENIAKKVLTKPYSYIIQDDKIIISEIFLQIIHDIEIGTSPSYISYRFHFTIADIVASCCNIIFKETGIRDIVLSGGVFQNILLTELVLEKLKEDNFNIFLHRQVPPNDASIPLGQIYHLIINS
ncbi:MAG: carbamoyltransferase HypF [Deferribacterales bacterium]